MTNATESIKHTAKVFILSALALTSVAGQAQTSCGKKSSARDILVAAQLNSGEVVATDSRVFISEIVSNKNVYGKMGLEAAQAAADIAQASVQISGATLNGKPLNEFVGTGIAYGNPRYVITVRHNVNEGRFERNENGVQSIKMNYKAKPIGARVDIEHNLTGQNSPIKNKGTVVAVGSFQDGINGEYTLIRLDKPAPGKLPRVLLDEDQELIGAKMMAFGLPADKRLAGNSQIVVDTECSGVERTSDGIITNCRGASGNSGGPVAGRLVIDKKGTRAWGIVGMAVQVVESNSLVAGQTSGADIAKGDIRMINLNNIHSTIMSDMEADMIKNPR